MDSKSYDWDIFMAHAGDDLKIAEELYDLLVPHAKVFLDSHCLVPGDDWDQSLALAQNRSLITVVLVSASTEKAYYQREEIAAAIDMARQKEAAHRVIPIYLDVQSGKGEGIPYGLRRKHGIFLPELRSLKDVAEKLLWALSQIKGANRDEEKGLPQTQVIAEINRDIKSTTSHASIIIKRLSSSSLATELRLVDGQTFSGLMPFVDSVEERRLAEKVDIVPQLSFRYSDANMEAYTHEIGKELYETAFSQPIKSILKSLPPTSLDLVIGSDLQYLPWELVHNGNEFLALKHNLGRHPTMQGPDSAGNIPKSNVRQLEDLKMLIVASSPIAYQEEIPEEAMHLMRLLANYSLRVNTITGTKHEFVDRLYEGQDIVHVIGHASGDSFAMQDGFVDFALLQEAISQSNRRCLFFVNACETAHSDRIRSQPTGYKLATENLAAISPLTWIEDRSAMTLAELFYRRLLTGASFGESLRLAKSETPLATGVTGTTGWYVLFGNPDDTILNP